MILLSKITNVSIYMYSNNCHFYLSQIISQWLVSLSSIIPFILRILFAVYYPFKHFVCFLSYHSSCGDVDVILRYSFILFSRVLAVDCLPTSLKFPKEYCHKDQHVTIKIKKPDTFSSLRRRKKWSNHNNVYIHYK